MSCCTILDESILYYTIQYYTILYYTILYYIILYYTILYYAILYYTILYCTVLYCTILYYTILYYTTLLVSWAGRVPATISLSFLCTASTNRGWSAFIFFAPAHFAKSVAVTVFFFFLNFVCKMSRASCHWRHFSALSFLLALDRFQWDPESPNEASKQNIFSVCNFELGVPPSALPSA